MTDGLENASREWAHPQVKQLIEKQTNDYQWQFLYLGADQDAVEVGMSIGVGAGHSVTYGRGKVKQAMAATAANVASYRQARAAGMPAPAAAAMTEFTEKQRRDVGGVDVRRRVAVHPGLACGLGLAQLLDEAERQDHDREDQPGEDQQGGPAGGDVLVGRHRVGVVPSAAGGRQPGR